LERFIARASAGEEDLPTIEGNRRVTGGEEAICQQPLTPIQRETNNLTSVGAENGAFGGSSVYCGRRLAYENEVLRRHSASQKKR
jgi:hypothetical protein